MRNKLNVELRGLIDETLVTCYETMPDSDFRQTEVGISNFQKVYFNEIHAGVLDLSREFGLEELTLE
jgi:hypothetical protein